MARKATPAGGKASVCPRGTKGPENPAKPLAVMFLKASGVELRRGGSAWEEHIFSNRPIFESGVEERVRFKYP